MNTTNLPCKIVINETGTIDFSGMTPEFAEVFIGCAMIGANAEKDFAQHLENFVNLSLALSPDPDGTYED